MEEKTAPKDRAKGKAPSMAASVDSTSALPEQSASTNV
jgi:hypothetical protein